MKKVECVNFWYYDGKYVKEINFKTIEELQVWLDMMKALEPQYASDFDLECIESLCYEHELGVLKTNKYIYGSMDEFIMVNKKKACRAGHEPSDKFHYWDFVKLDANNERIVYTVIKHYDDDYTEWEVVSGGEEYAIKSDVVCALKENDWAYLKDAV